MARKLSVYSKVDFKTLKNEISEIIQYLNSEPVDDTLVDNIDYKITKTGGVTPLIVSSIEKKIETQMNSIDTCSRILKAIFDKESLSEFVKVSIEILTEKLAQIEYYYSQRPISKLGNRKITLNGKKPMTITACSKEDQISSRNRLLEKIYKVKPLITELESMKEEVILKGGYDIPESMMYD